MILSDNDLAYYGDFSGSVPREDYNCKTAYDTAGAWKRVVFPPTHLDYTTIQYPYSSA
jgi:hypothetical protein